MLEAVTLNLVASGLASGSSIGVEKARDILRRERFSKDVDGLPTEFNTALKNAIKTISLENHVQEEISDVEANWTTIAEELDDTELVFDDEQEAIVRITNAIGNGLDNDLETNPELRDALEIAVAEAYQTTLRKFADRVAGTDLADVFNTEANIKLITTVNSVDERLTALQRQLRRHETAALRNMGFIRLDPLYFERHEPSNPETAWRTGFDFVEVKEDYPLPRERPSPVDEGNRQAVTDEVLERLDNGENLVVLGEGGSGKSTVCKQVACHWYSNANRGSVFYRGSTTTTSFDEPGTLIESLRAVEEETLVVVEDATTGNATAIYEVLYEFSQNPHVSFLLDSRTSHWKDADDLLGEATLERQRQKLGVVEMPALDEKECQRAVDHYETLTDQETSVTGEQLYKEVRNAEIGGPLVLAYQLTGPRIEANKPVSALHADVRRAYSDVKSQSNGDELPQTVAAMVNVLNAAEMPVDSAFVHALADSREDHRIIEHTLGFLEGTMLEQASEGIRMPHQSWSALYLKHMLSDAGKRLARDRFEECVNALFRLTDDENYREQVSNWLRDKPDVFTPLTETPNQAADWMIKSVAWIGRANPELGVLYGTPNTWHVSLPEHCSLTSKVRWLQLRGETHINRGDFDAAQEELKQLENLIESVRDEEVSELERRQAKLLDNLGLVAWKRGELGTAEKYHAKSRTIAREIDGRDSESRSLTHLGVVAHKRGNLDTAEEYLEEALDILREIDHRHGRIMILTNLGHVASKRGDLTTAEEYHRKCLSLAREMGNRDSEAQILGNLGYIADLHGDLKTAEEHHKKSLAAKQETGDRHGEAQTLVNLGSVVSKRDDLDAAEEHYQNGLQIFQSIGARQGKSRALNNLGLIARERGKLDAANDYFERSLTIEREIGDRHGEAQSLANLGLVARDREKPEAANKYFKESLAIAQEIGDQKAELQVLNELKEIAQERDDLDALEQHSKNIISIHQKRDNLHGEAHELTYLGMVKRMQGDLEIAVENLGNAIRIFLDAGNTSCSIHTFEELVKVHEQETIMEDAIAWCNRAIELAEENKDSDTSEELKSIKSELKLE